MTNMSGKSKPNLCKQRMYLVEKFHYKRRHHLNKKYQFTFNDLCEILSVEKILK